MLGALTMSRLLTKMKEVEASDLHIKIHCAPILRVGGLLHKVDAPLLESEDTEQLLDKIIPDHMRDDLRDRGGIDFSYHMGVNERFRCSVFHAGNGLHAAIRRVNPVVPSFTDLNLPPIYEEMAQGTHEGLIVVCGVTGCGKSTTLASMIDHINATRALNIITIEDPVEYALQSKMSYISQREVGLDVPDFATALRAAVRQDPDIIMIGELRDRNTMMAGIQSAETGHLVFCTLHTSDTMQSFARILEFFPQVEHNFLRSSLAAGLRAVMAQRLIPSVRKDTKVVPATEVLLNTPIVSEKIREGEDGDLPAVMAGSEHEGMHDFTSSIAELVEKDWVDMRTAEQFAPNRDALRSKVRGIDVKADTLIQRVK